jgi:NitT/TauT family transport system substrate-binding protein
VVREEIPVVHRVLWVAALLAAFVATGARAADKVTGGIVGGYNAFTWPITIAEANGLFAKHGIELDVIFVNSSPAMLQQVAAGSLDIAIGPGLVDPVRLVARGGTVAIARFELRVSPYVLIAKPAFAAIAELRGKEIGIGSRNDITAVLIEKMLGSAGLKSSDVDLLYSGSTGARYAALKTGAFDAALLAPPLSFTAVGEGFKQLGVAGDYAKDLPFSGSVVNRGWAMANLDTARSVYAAYDEAVDWLHDPANRDAAIRILVAASQGSADDAAKTYDFLEGGDYFDRTHKVSRRGIAALVETVHELGDADVSPTPEQCIVPGLTNLTD